MNRALDLPAYGVSWRFLTCGWHCVALHSVVLGWYFLDLSQHGVKLHCIPLSGGISVHNSFHLGWLTIRITSPHIPCHTVSEADRETWISQKWSVGSENFQDILFQTLVQFHDSQDLKSFVIESDAIAHLCFQERDTTCGVYRFDFQFGFLAKIFWGKSRICSSDSTYTIILLISHGL